MVRSEKQYIYFFSIITLSVIINFYLPRAFSYFFFYSLIVVFYFSRINSFWFAFILFLTDAPGRLFPIGNPLYGLPNLDIGFYLSYQEIFIYVALIKSLFIKTTSKNYYYYTLLLLFVYAVFLLAYSFAQGTSMLIFLNSIKWLIPWSLLYSIPRLIKTEHDWQNFFSLIYPLLFISLAAQLFQLFTGYSMNQLFIGSNSSGIEMQVESFGRGVMFDPTFKVYRLMGSFYIVLLSFIGALFYLSSKVHYFSKKYLIAIIFICYFSVLLSSTRGWILAFSVILLLYFLFVYKGFKPVVNLIIVILPLVLLLFQLPIIQKQFQGISNRVASMGTVFEGDITAGGTSARYNEYTPELISVFEKSPVFGWGFSKTYWDNMNEHAGMANLLMQTGITGFIIVLYFWWQLIYYPISFSSNFSGLHPYKKSLKALSLGVILILIIHSTSGQHFSFLIGYYNRSFAVLIFLAFSTFYLSESRKLNFKLKESAKLQGSEIKV